MVINARLYRSFPTRRGLVGRGMTTAFLTLVASLLASGHRMRRLTDGLRQVLAGMARVAVIATVTLFGLSISHDGFQPARAELWGAHPPGTDGLDPEVVGSDGCSIAMIDYARQFNDGTVISCTRTGISPTYYANVTGHTPGEAQLLGCDSGYLQVPGGCAIATPLPPPPCNCPTPPKDHASTPVGNEVGDPVDPLTGRLIEQALDYESAGPFPLRFWRTYSETPRFSMFSSGNMFTIRHSAPGGIWRSNFEASMFYAQSIFATVFYFELPGDREILFVQSGSGAYLPAILVASGTSATAVAGPTGGSQSLSYNTTNSTFTVTDGDGTQYTFPSVLNAVSPVSQIAYRGGYVQTLTYNPTSGTLTSVSDSLGRSLGFQYGSVGQLTTLTANGATVATYTYLDLTSASFGPGGFATYYPNGLPAGPDLTATLASVTHTATGATTSYAYGLAATSITDVSNIFRLTSVTDALGNVASTWAYDSVHHVFNNTLAGGVSSTNLTYASVGTTPGTTGSTTVTNAFNSQTVQATTVSPNGNLLQTQTQIQATGSIPVATTTYAYDSNDLLSSVTDAEGRVTAYGMNDPSTGLPASITRGAGSASAATTSFTWNTQWRVPSQVIEPGRTTTYAWNALGQLTSKTVTDTTTTTVPYSTNGQARTWTYAYGANNLLSSVTGPLTGEVVSYTYNSTGFIETVTDELGHVTTVTAWNSLGQPTSLTDPNGVITALGYDGEGRLTSVAVDTAGTPATTTIAYTLVGDIAQITEPNGAWTKFTYDGAQRLTTMTNADGDNAVFTRDVLGDLTALSLTSGVTHLVPFSTTQTFDVLGRLVTRLGIGTQTYTFGYDRTNNVTTVADPNSYVFSNGFDALNRLISQTNEVSQTVTLTRNGVDDITAYTDPRSLTTGYVRNGFGEIIQETSPDRGTIVYTRDLRGEVTQTVNARSQTLTYTYDLAGRITSETNVSTPTQNIAYTYDQTTITGCASNWGIGRLTTVTDITGTTQRCYDQKGRMTEEYRTIGGASRIGIGYTFDLSGNLTQMALPSGHQITWGRDAMGRVNQISVQGGTGFPSAVNIASPVVFAPYGPPTSLTFGNGIVETYGLTNDYHISSVLAVNSSGTQLISRGLSWTGEVLNSIADSVTPADSESFTYTHDHRLASASGVYGSLAWTYDANGNRATQVVGSATQTYSISSTSNRVASISQTGTSTRSFAYNLSGDRTSDTTGSTTLTQSYDAHERVMTFQSNSTTEGEYAYDAFSRLGNRITLNITPAGQTHYLYDQQGHVVVETDNTGASLREYIWLDDMPVGIIDQVNTSSPVLYYVHADHLNRPIMVTNGSGASVWTAVWEPFGQPYAITTSPLIYNARFPGQWFQFENGLNWNWNRHYDPSTGTYLQADPAGLEALLSDGPSVYAYVGGNPTSVIDPDGLAGRVLSPQSRECMDLARKIQNIQNDIQSSQQELDTNPLGLPETALPGTPLRGSVAGHRQLLAQKQATLVRRIEEYRAKCGCDPPSGSPAPAPAPAPSAPGGPHISPYWIIPFLAIPFPGNPLYFGI